QRPKVALHGALEVEFVEKLCHRFLRRQAQVEVELADARLDGLRLRGCCERQRANERGGDEVLFGCGFHDFVFSLVDWVAHLSNLKYSSLTCFDRQQQRRFGGETTSRRTRPRPDSPRASCDPQWQSPRPSIALPSLA